ncbi:MAG: hypothetical protein F6K24_47055 [Okeania sp. SIO2D1]|nr:hypothetical protein [Okeania sp. SIO2D1]
MNTQEQARALMIRHNQIIRNRQQSLLGRAAEEIGLDIDTAHYNNHIQGKIRPEFRNNYARSGSSLS